MGRIVKPELRRAGFRPCEGSLLLPYYGGGKLCLQFMGSFRTQGGLARLLAKACRANSPCVAVSGSYMGKKLQLGVGEPGEMLREVKP